MNAVETSINPKSWFESWFGSYYYDLLYDNRDEKEADGFINKLLTHLNPEQGSTMLDLACGKGRFSKFLAQKGYFVTGLDIAEDNIKFARQLENENLSFFTHDMRLPFRVNYFDYIFNFFTSFGYFETYDEHIETIKNISSGLKQNGTFVLDFFNSQFVIDQLRPRDFFIKDKITFDINRKVEEGQIIKTILVDDNYEKKTFQERVRAFSLADFKSMFTEAGLDVTMLFGDYDLNPYVPSTSPRLIIVARKG